MGLTYFFFGTKLRDFFIRLEFEVIELPLVIESGMKREEEGRDSHESRLSSAFYTQVTEKCTEEAIIVIYITGIQFPLKTDLVSFVFCFNPQRSELFSALTPKCELSQHLV